MYAPPDLTFSRALNAIAASGFAGGLITDLTYWRTADFIWVDASDWLVSAGVVIGVLAFIVAVVETAIRRRNPLTRRAILPAVLRVAAWAVGALNMFMHSRDGWTSVVPFGAALSLVTVVLLAIPLFLPRAYATPSLAPASEVLP